MIAAYGRWLSFLAASEPQAMILPPSERLKKDLLARYLAHLAETAGTVGQHMFFAKLRDAGSSEIAGARMLRSPS